MSNPRTLFDKVWADHIVVEETPDIPAVLYIDLHIVHEVTTPQAFSVLREKHLPVRRPDLTLPTLDHSTPTTPVSTFKDLLVAGEGAANQVRQMQQNCEDFGLDLLGFGSGLRGIVHVIGPELGATQPGKTIVCGDSHSSTHGAFGALAFGIGTTEVGHVLATQCLLQRKPKTLAINVDGMLPEGVTAKDLILAIIGKIGVDGGTGYVIEFRGEAIRAMDMESRMTICNMSIEAGARAGMIAPDETTFEYLRDRPRAPQGDDWDKAVVTNHFAVYEPNLDRLDPRYFYLLIQVKFFKCFIVHLTAIPCRRGGRARHRRARRRRRRSSGWHGRAAPRGSETPTPAPSLPYCRCCRRRRR